MRRAAALGDLGVDRARDDVARRELQPLRVVALHEPLAARVAQDAALAADRLGDEQPGDARRPDHPGRMELHELHVDQLGARLVRERVPVAGALPRVRRDPPAPARAAGREHDRARREDDELAGRAPVAERAADALAVLEQPRDRALHEDVDAGVDGLVLQRADQLEAGAVADVHEALVGVAAERALRHLAGRACGRRRRPTARARARGRAPPRVQLGHAPVVEVLAAEHRVLEVRPASCPRASTLPSAAATPPSAITVCALPSSDLQTSAVRAPALGGSIAARSPAPPAPITTTSWSWRLERISDDPRIVEDAARGQPDVEVGERRPRSG